MSEHTQQEMARLRDQLAEANERQAEIVARMHRLRETCPHENTTTTRVRLFDIEVCDTCGRHLIETARPYAP